MLDKEPFRILIQRARKQKKALYSCYNLSPSQISEIEQKYFSLPETIQSAFLMEQSPLNYTDAIYCSNLSKGLKTDLQKYPKPYLNLENCKFQSTPPSYSPKKKVPVLGLCLLDAARTYEVPPAVLTGILKVEDGQPGAQYGPQKDGSYDLGPMRINSTILLEVAKYWGITEKEARRMVRNDPCVNVNVAAWLLRQRLNESGNLTLAISQYHSKNERYGYPYARKVIQAMDTMDLIKTGTNEKPK